MGSSMEIDEVNEKHEQDISIANGVVQSALRALMDAKIDPLVTAAVFATTGLSVYKVTLSETEYHIMVDNISETRNQILPALAPRREIIH